MATRQAKIARDRAYFFEKYCQGKGIDIGCKDVKVLPDVVGYDKIKYPGVDIVGNAQFMSEIGDEEYDWVYSSHCLEHIEDLETGLRNWWRILKPGGHMMISVPHRDYYERKLRLPSIYNPSHFRFFLPFESDPPDTVSLYDLLRQTLDNVFIRCINECSDATPVHRTGELRNVNPHIPVPPECSIEAVVQKGILTPMFEVNYDPLL